MITRAYAGLGAGVLILAGIVSGCSDDGGSELDFADRSYAEIKESALEAMESLEAVHVAATLSSEGQSAGFDLSMSTAGNCTGSVNFGEASAEVLRTDAGAWYKPSPELLAQAYPEQATEVAEFIGDSWVVDGEGQVTASNCDLKELINQLSDDEGESNTEVAGVEELDGQDVVRLDYTNESGDGSAYILVDGEHYIVKIELKGDEPGTALFSEFDETVDAETPADDEIVDLDDFKP